MKRRMLPIATIILILVFPVQAYSENLWGAITVGLTPNLEKKGNAWYHVPCHYFAGMGWNYPTKRKAFIGAREACRKRWMNTGSVAHLINETNCGDLKHDDPLASGGIGVYFRSGQCAAYASGKWWLYQGHHGMVQSRCPTIGLAVSTSKADAERIALAKCNDFKEHPRDRSTCRITLSQCMK